MKIIKSWSIWITIIIILIALGCILLVLEKPIYTIGLMPSITKEDIVVTTDRPEYGQGEIIAINLKNNLKENIFWHDSIYGIEYLEKKASDGSWEQLYVSCQYPYCVLDLVEAKQIESGDKILMKWNPLIFINGTTKTIPIGSGRYRLVISYNINQEAEFKQAYSNEFVIK